jgi:hypothetical protein
MKSECATFPSAFLRSLGYEVLEAAHGDDAKRLLTRRRRAQD